MKCTVSYRIDLLPSSTFTFVDIILTGFFFLTCATKTVSGSNTIQNTSHLHNTQQHQASNPQAMTGNYTNNPYSRYTGFLTYNTNNTIPHNTNNTNTPHQMQHPTLRCVFLHYFFRLLSLFMAQSQINL